MSLFSHPILFPSNFVCYYNQEVPAQLVFFHGISNTYSITVLDKGSDNINNKCIILPQSQVIHQHPSSFGGKIQKKRFIFCHSGYFFSLLFIECHIYLGQIHIDFVSLTMNQHLKGYLKKLFEIQGPPHILDCFLFIYFFAF